MDSLIKIPLPTTPMELIDAVNESQIESSERDGFMMSELGRIHVKRLKDADENYLWQSASTSPSPGYLLGYQIVINNNIGKQILFGDLGV